MTQGAQAQQSMDPLREEAAQEFKRHILEKTASFVSEPMADLCRVEMLGRMLDRYDELLDAGLVAEAAIRRTKADFNDAAEEMRQQGFATLYDRMPAEDSRWPEITENEAVQYLKESSEGQHKRAIGIGLCSACVTPILLGAALDELFRGSNGTWSMMGVLGMFGLIGLGVYAIITPKAPSDDKKIKSGKFALGYRLRERLNALKEKIDDKARRRIGKGVAMLVGCITPILFGGILDNIFDSDGILSILGVCGMFGMIGAGVYQLVMAGCEKSTISRLLKLKD